MINIGDSFEVKDRVDEQELAVSVGSGDLYVYSTPSVVALMENASMNLAKKALGEGITTVGTCIGIEHISPTPLGAEVTAKATLVKYDGRLFKFEVEAFDKKGIIAKGTHTRVSVKADKFQKKADEKLGEV